MLNTEKAQLLGTCLDRGLTFLFYEGAASLSHRVIVTRWLAIRVNTPTVAQKF